MSDWEPKYRYWVAQKRGSEWVYIYRTNWRWRARRMARQLSRRGFTVVVETR